MFMAEKKPFEIARETLKQITTRKLVPTPANYQAVYNEIAGIPTVGNFPADVLKDIAQALPTKTPGQQKQKGLLEYAIDRMNWDGVKTALVAYGGFVPASTDADTSGVAASKPAAVGASGPVPLTPEFLALIARMLEYSQPALGQDDERFAQQLTELVASLKNPSIDVLQLKTQLLNFSHRLSFVAEDQAEIKSGLLKLLQLVFENIADISIDDQWLLGQMEALKQASAPPLNLRRLDDVERRLKDVISKQKEAKERAVQAQEEMRQMLATFIDRLAELTQSTGTFQNKLEESARQIEQAKTLEEIAPVLREVVGTTRAMAAQSQTSQSELQQLQDRAQKTEAELAKLHQELDRVSIQARHDSLTGALNRKGLEEAANREISQMRRKESVLSVALLDIDNFKKLNDTLGHATGDLALSHLATVARECMRPQDTLARYGGEEFVILLPDTAVDNAVDAMTRLQRELTKRFFLSGSEKVLITFSAGVAQVAADEEPFEAIKRADKAMYLAKRAGKNRVLAA